jgi:hypothetical protein
MSSASLSPARRWLTFDRLVVSSRTGLAVTAFIHLAALAILYRTEWGLVHGALALLAWCLLNFAWLVVLRRPALSAALSLAIVGVLITVSQFKFEITWMTVTFLDLLIIDPDSVTFLLGVVPSLRATVIVVTILAAPLLLLLWRFDPVRVPRAISGGAAGLCLAGLAALSVAVPEEAWEPFQGVNHTSNFARSGVTQAPALLFSGWLQADAKVPDQLGSSATETCRPAAKPPHIIMVLDESSFDITAAPGIKVPPDYRRHFRSFDGRQRAFVAEGSGGPTWYSEYNVLTGLSARSFGHFKYFVTRIAAGRIERGLPRALRRCGYKTVTLYPAAGAFLGARRFQVTTGVERFVDQSEMGAADDQQPDRYYYDQALRVIERDKATAPVFVFVYLTANHFSWTWAFRPDLTPDWRGLGNEPAIDEYVRRQTMSARDYADFLARLKRDFPDESFLLVRFGDHQPAIAAKIVDPSLDDAAVAKRIMAFDPKYFTTYYAIDAINFTPVDVSSALDTLEGPYLPLVVQEAAGLPLDPSFAEQKRILQRCGGVFYACAGGAEARHFNRLLIDAGLIKRL